MRTSASSSSGGRRLAALLALSLVPWTVVVHADGFALVFPWALVTPAPLSATSVLDYLRLVGPGAPEGVLAWPTSVCCYLGAVGSVAGGAVVGREDRRVSAGLLVLAGLNHLVFALTLARGEAILPVGPLLLWAGAWWVGRDWR